MLKINDLCKSFDGKKVIENLSLEFPNNGFIAFCGPSGCGKTTLLRILMGLEGQDHGEIIFDIEHPRISVSFQEPRLLPERTALQNVNLVLGDKKATLTKAKELLMMLGINDFDLYPDELSGGMKARVSIARALAKEADIYIFDEPFANLDKDTAEKCAEVIKAKATHALIVAVLHDTALAERIADRVIYLK
jgi:ABC-type nitrate/sulfonate/bicarbonate transport system ATPase subunit